VRSLADKLLDRPELITRLREHIGHRLVMVEPWNVTESEVAVAEQLQAPINGMDPALRHLGFKSVGRRIFVAYGREDVRTVGDVVAVVGAIQAARPDVRTVVVNHCDSGAGDGNVLLDIREPDCEASGADAVRRRVMG
jgi:hypothetical protein